MPKSSTSQRKNKSRTCERSPSPGLLQQLQAIVSRLNVLEDNSRLGSTSVATIGGQPVVESPGPAVGTIVSRAPSTSRTTCVTPPLPSVHASQVSANDSAAIEVADKIVSAINGLIPVSDGVTPVIRSVVRDVALEGTSGNREALRELARQRASQLLDQNRKQQDTRVNERRKPPHVFHENDMVFVHKNSQSVGKLDSGMRGPYKVVCALPHGRYELKLISGSLGKTTEAAAEHISAWHGEWTPDVCAVFFECDENESCSDDSIIAGPSHLRDVTIAERAGEGAPPSGEAVLAENAQE
ncbi:unnamed protein product, partial [Brenthis ino]